MADLRPARTAAVTYHRVSTVDQDPSLARDELVRAAEARGLHVVLAVEETGSGARNDRPGLRQVMELAHQHRIAFVLVWKLDRFARSTIDAVTNVKKLRAAGVTLVATSQGFEVGPHTGAIGDLILTVMVAMAEFERAIISERTLLGLQAARQRGRVLGRPRGARDRGKRKAKGSGRGVVDGS